MSLLSLLNVPDDRVKEHDFYVLQESHLDFLRKHPETQSVEITLAEAEKYIGDFHGLLHEAGISKKYRYLVTRVNGLKSSVDYQGDFTRIVLPSQSVMAAIFTLYSSREN